MVFFVVVGFVLVFNFDLLVELINKIVNIISDLSLVVIFKNIVNIVI